MKKKEEEEEHAIIPEIFREMHPAMLAAKYLQICEPRFPLRKLQRERTFVLTQSSIGVVVMEEDGGRGGGEEGGGAKRA